MPPLRHAQPEAQVGHDRDHHRVAGQLAAVGQVQGEQGQQDVAVHDGTGVVDGDDPVGVTVEGEPEVGTACRRPRCRQVPGAGRAAPVVDVDAVGVVVQAIVTRARRPRSKTLLGATALAAPLAQSITMWRAVQAGPAPGVDSPSTDSQQVVAE